jgi:DNA-directed RNA polymerase subunit RPC12/RpoP
MAKNYRAIYRTCSDCGKEFIISPKFQEKIEENDLKLPKRCKECRDNRKVAKDTRICADCGEEFTITVNEHKFYEERGLTEPKRCKNCRKNKNGRSEENKQEQ